MTGTTSSPQFEIEGKPSVAARTVPLFGCGGRVRVEAILSPATGESYLEKDLVVCGWSKTVRKQGAGLVFIAINDGSCAANLQVVVTRSALQPEDEKVLLQAGTAVSFRICGKVVRSPKAGQAYEMQVVDAERHSVKVYGLTDQATFPLAKKAHSKEYLREIQHLRSRSYVMGCVTRIRSALALATHEFFQDRGFQYIHTPIITCSDCEGAGEMFQVTTLLPKENKVADVPVSKKSGMIDYSQDFFGKKAFLTVSGQLNVETYACALSDVYTFGPTFRAEMSHTARHLAEFWMIEPEMAFADLEDNMRCAEGYLRFCVQYVLDRHLGDLEWLEQNVETGLVERLRNIAESAFARLSYTEAVEILKQQPSGRFTVPAEWGFDMGSEHERFLAEELYKKPVIVYDYPKDIKSFYMKLNSDQKTVRAMDILVPKIGEVVGGSQREEDLGKLEAMIKEKELDPQSYSWYLDLRRYGTVPHSGFGVGFERLLMMVSGVENIRDVIPFPRYPGNADF